MNQTMIANGINTTERYSTTVPTITLPRCQRIQRFISRSCMRRKPEENGDDAVTIAPPPIHFTNSRPCLLPRLARVRDLLSKEIESKIHGFAKGKSLANA